MSRFQLTPSQIAGFEQDGFLLVPGLYNPEEAALLKSIAKADRDRVDHLHSVNDPSGAASKIWLQNDLHVDIYGAVVRSRRLVNSMEQLLGGEVYHYHHKMTIKEPLVAGAWVWHQDYGYWYHNGCLFPLMASCMIAVDPCSRDNGCLQVLRGSHQMGRIEHGQVTGQTGADLERVEEAKKVLDLVYCEMAPGDGLFFHCNLLHYSGPNTSPNPRWTLICCYNAARNNPYKDSGHPRYSYLEKWPDERVMEVGLRQWRSMQPGNDKGPPAGSQ